MIYLAKKQTNSNYKYAKKSFGSTTENSGMFNPDILP